MHSLSGCDIVSAFHGIGKKTAWTVWCSLLHIKPIFAHLSHAPSKASGADMVEIDKYVNDMLLYQHTEAMWMMHWSSSLHLEITTLRTFYHLRMPLNNMWNELFTQLDIFGAKHLWQLLMYQHLLHGVGKERVLTHLGHYFGQLFQRLQLDARSYWNVDTSKQISNAHNCFSALDNAIEIKIED